jgi:hypothetical protein
MNSGLISTSSQPSRNRSRLRCRLIVCASVIWPLALAGQNANGVLILRTLNGAALADGELTQTVRGDRATIRLVFHFKDGSLHDETVVYAPSQRFGLATYHLVQKGPAFPQPLDMSIDRSIGEVVVRYAAGGAQKIETEHIDVPPDLANGLISTILRNAQTGSPPKTVSFVVATPKPRLVKLAITSAGDEPFPRGGAVVKAAHYVLKVEIGGVSGVLAPLVGKQPPDSHVWILRGETPAFAKSEQPFYLGGPLWRIEVVR